MFSPHHTGWLVLVRPLEVCVRLRSFPPLFPGCCLKQPGTCSPSGCYFQGHFVLLRLWTPCTVFAGTKWQQTRERTFPLTAACVSQASCSFMQTLGRDTGCIWVSYCGRFTYSEIFILSTVGREKLCLKRSAVIVVGQQGQLIQEVKFDILTRKIMGALSEGGQFSLVGILSYDPVAEISTDWRSTLLVFHPFKAKTWKKIVFIAVEVEQVYFWFVLCDVPPLAWEVKRLQDLKNKCNDLEMTRTKEFFVAFPSHLELHEDENKWIKSW